MQKDKLQLPSVKQPMQQFQFHLQVIYLILSIFEHNADSHILSSQFQTINIFLHYKTLFSKKIEFYILQQIPKSKNSFLFEIFNRKNKQKRKVYLLSLMTNVIRMKVNTHSVDISLKCLSHFRVKWKPTFKQQILETLDPLRVSV